MIGYSQWAPDRVSQVDMTAFLIINGIPQFAERFHHVLAGKDGEFVGHISIATKVSFIPGLW